MCLHFLSKVTPVEHLYPNLIDANGGKKKKEKREVVFDSQMICSYCVTKCCSSKFFIFFCIAGRLQPSAPGSHRRSRRSGEVTVEEWLPRRYSRWAGEFLQVYHLYIHDKHMKWCPSAKLGGSSNRNWCIPENIIAPKVYG